MNIWSDSEITSVTGGVSSGSWSGGKICIDSRKLERGDIFVALKGQHSDGYEFISDALDKGAAGVIVEQEPNVKCNYVVVKNCFCALEDLALFKRKNSKAQFIAVTGSVGKTSTKEILGSALQIVKKTFVGRGNYNNRLGVMINLASMPRDAELAVFELGMNHAGEISKLSDLVRPDIAMITNVAPVHIEYFNSLEDIAIAKSEILDGMTESSNLILFEDNPYFDLINGIAKRKNITVRVCGDHGICRVISTKNDDEFLTITARLGYEDISYKLPIYAKHHLNNTLFVLVVVWLLEIDVKRIFPALMQYQMVSGRGNTKIVEKDCYKIRVIDDSYNASPLSMLSSLSILSEYPGRKIAVLSDMLELGKDGVEYHKDLMPHIIKHKIDKVITYGNLMAELYKVLPPEKQLYHASHLDELKEFIRKSLQNNDVILIKGSNGTKISQIAKFLTDEV